MEAPHLRQFCLNLGIMAQTEAGTDDIAFWAEWDGPNGVRGFMSRVSAAGPNPLLRCVHCGFGGAW